VNTGQLAELIAAGFFAAGVCAAVYVLFRLARLISAATTMMSDYRDRADLLIDRAQAAVDRAGEQLTRTDAITASMDDVTANMAELSGHVSAMAGLARAITGGFGAPLLRLSALAYGVRRATGLRLGTQAAGPAGGLARRAAGTRQTAQAQVSGPAPGPAIEQHSSSGGSGSAARGSSSARDRGARR
jgi:Bacterial protein of unknown function (DUF948)